MKNYLCLTAFLLGCGGGVSDSKKLTELTMAEAKEVCIEIAEEHPPRTVTCGSFTFTFGQSAAECDGDVPTGTACTATVGDARKCQDDMAALTDEQICMGGGESAACAKLEGCGADGG